MQLDESGNILHFGARALAKSEDAPERTFQNFKVFVGSKDKTFQIQTAQEIYTPDKLALLYLTQLRKLIEEQFFNGSKLSNEQDLFCVIGYPADWDNVRKENLKNIAQEAGFVNIKLCDEPTGVIYFNHFFGGLKFKKSQNILVYDFGGGTTDVAIAQVDISDNGEIKPSIRAVGGLPNLGGSNFDEAIVAHYLNENNYDLSALSSKEKLHDKWVINLAAREAKEDLSKKDAVEKNINRLKVAGGAKPQKLSLSRDEFMTVCSELIEKFDEPIYDALTIAGLAPEDIDFVILAGGSSAMPYVKQKMNGIFTAKKIFISPSTEIIAQGLSLFGKVTVVGNKTTVTSNASENTAKSTGSTMEAMPVYAEPKKHGFGFYAAAAVVVVGIGWGALHIYDSYKDNSEQLRLQAQLEQERTRQLQLQAQAKEAEAARAKAEQQRLQAEREKVEEQRRYQAQIEQQRRQQYARSQPQPKESNTGANIAAGAAMGAAAGSFIPFVGTAAGAVIGGVAGWLFGD